MVSSSLQPVLFYPTTPSAPWPSSALPESGQVSLELLFLPLEVLNIFHLRGGGDGVIQDPRAISPRAREATLLTALPSLWCLCPQRVELTLGLVMNNQTGIYRGLPDIQFPSYSLKTKCPRSQGTWYHHWVDSSKLGLHTPSSNTTELPWIS